jgi:hypothetical protein
VVAFLNNRYFTRIPSKLTDPPLQSVQTLGVEYSPLHGAVLGKDFLLGNGGVGRDIFKHPGPAKYPSVAASQAIAKPLTLIVHQPIRQSQLNHQLRQGWKTD